MFRAFIRYNYVINKYVKDVHDAKHSYMAKYKKEQ